jgi:putative multiple sugar transport system substrate-binding protein
MKTSKLLLQIVTFAMVLALVAACAAPAAAPTAAPAAPAAAATTAPAAPSTDQKTIGISMPTKSSERWISDGESMVKAFEALGYKTDLQFAEDDIPNQVAQIENMVTKGADVLVIAAIDGTTLSDILQKAKDQGVTVMAYDRLISKTPNVDYYATFDNFQVGVIQASQIEKALGLKEGKGPFNIELFGGSPDDTNAFYFYDGAMSVLQPYIDSGKLVVQSNQTGMDKVSTLRWDGAVAQARMDNLLSAFYTDKRVDAVLSPYDGLSRGILSSLRGVGYGSADQPWPVVTGQDAEVASVKQMIAGEQQFTVFKDTRELAKQTAKMVDAALKGQEVEINDTKTYDNGVKIVPSYLLVPQSVDITNYKQLLIDSGYLTEDQVGAAPAPAANPNEGALIGISMPTKSSERWISDGESMVKAFEDLGYKTDLQFAEDDIPNQVAQIENMVTKGAKVLIIAAIDGTTLSDILQKAKDQGVLVMAYDRLISKTPNVDYYSTFDNFGVGVIQGSQIEEALGLKDGKGPFNIELFGGSPDDTNAFYFYDGAMSVLQPYIDSGKLVVQSNQTGMDKVSTLRWDGAVAQARMDNLLSAFYTDKRVDAVLAPYDGLSRGILSSLRGVGYGSADQPWPVVTGQDAEVASVKQMIAGEQMFTVFKDTRELAKQTAKMVDAALKGQEVEINDTKTYDNGVKIVPSYLLIPLSVDINNYEELLIDSGYLTAEELK